MSETIILHGRPTDEIFTFVPGDGDEPYHFNISAIVRSLSEATFETWRRAGVEIGWTETPHAWCEQFIAEGKRHFEEDRVAQLVAPYIDQPLIMVAWPDGTSVLIDGTHRMLRAHRERWPKIALVRLPLSLALKFCLELPKELGVLDKELRVPNDARGALLKKLGVV